MPPVYRHTQSRVAESTAITTPQHTPTQPMYKPPQHPHQQPFPPATSPIVGITPDITEPKPASQRAMVALTYAHAVSQAGGLPIILPPDPALIPQQLKLCSAIILTGGDDPRTEPFGHPTHPQANPIHPQRQVYELALLEALDHHPNIPTLGVCLGMQLMALHHGGSLNQYMPDTIPTHADHTADARHTITRTAQSHHLPHSGTVTSHHRQSVQTPGTMRVIATAHDGVIEAIDLPGRPFYLGLQWHPERTTELTLGPNIFKHLIAAAIAASNQHTHFPPPITGSAPVVRPRESVTPRFE